MKARSKKFLSDNHSEFGTVSWYVTSPDFSYFCSYKFVNAELRIADCSETITLDFNADSEKHAKKRIDKLTTLIDSLVEMRENMEKVVESSKRKFYY